MADFAPSDVTVGVRALLSDPDARVSSWQAEDVHWRVVSEVTDGLRRLRGTALGKGGLVAWSLIVKTARPAEPSDQSWRREVEAYTSGLLRTLPEVRPARLLHVTRSAPDRIALWLEDVPDETPEVWPLKRHVVTARHLGQFNAAHEVDVVPVWAWRDWLDGLHPRLAPADDERVWSAPIVREAFEDAPLEALERVRESHDRWRVLLDALPVTLVHLDAGRFNVRAESETRSVLLDWQALGVGPLGADLAMTHFLNVCRFYADPFRVSDLDVEAFEAYWNAVERPGSSWEAVRFAYSSVIAARTALVVRLLLPRLAAGDERLWASWGEKRGWSAREAVRAWGRGMTSLLSLAEEADRLAGHLAALPRSRPPGTS
ncbi:hypothetical protein [Deinococcus yavapaiensis]|uniref:Phosphotransferase family enzyme n=1 Tax=Deinococcus yavapaiensis KR-236 TaxID=694435 RepID=A0A318S2G3_9DEIO|nr:hypothetical protein [Deinococcus yavapaiensis]PYE49936.1 hypothetical protein DES52_12014 [Deinococcus yavapaiensis KR-236]